MKIEKCALCGESPRTGDDCPLHHVWYFAGADDWNSLQSLLRDGKKYRELAEAVEKMRESEDELTFWTGYNNLLDLRNRQKGGE